MEEDEKDDWMICEVCGGRFLLETMEWRSRAGGWVCSFCEGEDSGCGCADD